MYPENSVDKTCEPKRFPCKARHWTVTKLVLDLIVVRRLPSLVADVREIVHVCKDIAASNSFEALDIKPASALRLILSNLGP